MSFEYCANDLRKISYHNGGRISIKANVDINSNIEHPVVLQEGVEINQNTQIGRYTFINQNTIIYKNVKIGRYCSIGRNCEIGLSRHPKNFLSTHLFQIKDNQLFCNVDGYDALNKVEWNEHEDVIIGNDVWIGSQVSIIGGISIGDGSIVGAGSIVTKDIPAFSIYAGNPAKRISQRFSDPIIKELQDLKWWNLEIKYLANIDFTNINEAIKELKNRIL